MYVKAIIILCIIIFIVILLFFRGSFNRSGSGGDRTGNNDVRQKIRDERGIINDSSEQLKSSVGILRENNDSQRQSNNRIREILRKAKERKYN